MSTAEKLYEKARALPEPTQAALLQLIESLAVKPAPVMPAVAPRAGSAKGLLTIAPDFDAPLEDFKPFTE
jgi:hypothetical protein